MELKKLGLKNTKTRGKIWNILEKSTEPLTAFDISKELSDSDANLSTIYRTLTSFSSKGLVTREIKNDGKTAFSIKKEEHQHILVCSICHKKIFLKECPFKAVKADVYSETGFLIEDHNIELYGICSDCQNRQ